MEWYSKMTKLADSHGNTFHGQFLNGERKKLIEKIVEYKKAATSNGLEDIVARWRGDIRRAIQTLPATERVQNMSLYEVKELAEKVDQISEQLERYKVKPNGDKNRYPKAPKTS
jgi:DNA polymerase III delta prime subunit